MSGQFNHPAYTRRYAQFKKDEKLDNGPWRLHDNLVESLEAFKTEDGWMGGIPDGPPVNRISMFGGKKPHSITIAKYARTLECGSGVQKERPVFKPTTDEFENSGFPEEVNKSAAMLRNAWR